MNRTLRPSQWCLWLISPLMLVGSAWAQSDEPLPPLPADPDAPPVDLPPATPVAPPAAQPSPPASPLYPPAPGSGYGTPAQYGYPSPPPAPPVPPAQPPTGVYLHDGFYLRMALGLGLHNITVAPHPGDTIHASTQNLLFDVGVGGTPMDGFAIGGRILEM
ncbi:MAG TPA: hypothetical protein PLV85_20970, partial [Polyangiaceae bacterium]|nr:hypothetical protein [Polyangiaceae bacterium]